MQTLTYPADALEMHRHEITPPENLMISPETIQEKTVEFPIPPQTVGVRIGVAEDPGNSAVILQIVGMSETAQNISMSLAGAHALAAALNRSANRIGRAQFVQGKKVRYGN